MSKIKIIDTNQELIGFLRHNFSAPSYHDVEIIHGDVLDFITDSTVICTASNPDFNPAGGLDAALAEKFPNTWARAREGWVDNLFFAVTVDQNLKASYDLVFEAIRDAHQGVKSEEVLILTGMGTGVGGLDNRQYLAALQHGLRSFDNAWVSCNAKVYDDARILGNAEIHGNARIYGHARILGNAQILGYADISDDAQIFGDAEVYTNAQIFGDAEVFDNAKVLGHARVHGHALIYGNAVVSGNAEISDRAEVFDNAQVYGIAEISDDAKVSGNAKISDDAKVSGHARVYGDARIHGSARVYGKARTGENQRIIGHLSVDITEGKNIEQSIYAQTLHCPCPVAQEIILFKRVRKSEAGRYFSLHEGSFEYKVGETATVGNPNTDPTASCTSGLHFSHLHYWDEGNAALAAKIKVSDIVAVQEGKIRCRKAEILAEVI